MKILYAIQGTGNGHISRARSIIPALKRRGNVDILLSGSQVDVALDHPIKYRCQGLGFIFGKRGGIDLMSTYRKNKLKSFKKEIRELPVEEYDLVISDFEPVSAWACLQKAKPCISLSHQSAVLHDSSPRPKDKDFVGAAFLNYYAPASKHYGFHFRSYESGIFTPVIREGVRSLSPRIDDHYTVYLPAYSDKRIIEILLHFPAIQWEVFSKHTRTIIEEQNVFVRPIHDNLFLQSIATSRGVLCGAGFETPAEALFLKKKLMVIPMKGQYEQQCNAAALRQMGVPVLKGLSTKEIGAIDQWLDNDTIVEVAYPDQTEMVIETLLRDWKEMNLQVAEGKPPYGGRFRKSLFQKVVARYIST